MAKTPLLIPTDEKILYQMISIDLIEDVKTRENKELTKSIHQQGIIEPIILSLQTNGTYKIESGRRRVKSARILGLTELEAKVIVHSSNVRMLASNMVRRPNPAHEFSCIRDLAGSMETKEIAAQVGVSIARVKAYTKYLALNPTLQQKIIDGEISLRCAKELLKLPMSAQQEIAETESVITTKSVQEIAKHTKGAHVALEDLPISLFSDRITLINQVRQAILVANNIAPEAIGNLQAAQAIIENSEIESRAA